MSENDFEAAPGGGIRVAEAEPAVAAEEAKPETNEGVTKPAIAVGQGKG